MLTGLTLDAKKVLQVVIVILSILSCATVFGQEQSRSLPAEKTTVMPLQQSQDWNIQFSHGYLPSADLHGINASAEISDYRFRLNRNIKLDSKTTISVGGAYGLKQIYTTGAAALPQDLHSLAFEGGLNYRINERTFARLRLSPGFYSDFENLGSDDVRMPLLAMGGYSFDNGLTMVGGFIYRVGYHSSPFFPVIGFTYQPNQNWNFDLVAPRPGVKYIPSKQVRLFLAGDFASDEYELKDASSGAKAMKYRDYKVIGGAEYLPVSGTRLTGALGYAFDRSFEFYDGPRGHLHIDDVPFIRFSLDVGW